MWQSIVSFGFGVRYFLPFTCTKFIRWAYYDNFMLNLFATFVNISWESFYNEYTLIIG